MMQALTRHPLPKNFTNTVYSIAKKMVYLLSKANRVLHWVESLIFQKNILMSWLIDENNMEKELRSSKTIIASRVGGVC